MRQAHLLDGDDAVAPQGDAPGAGPTTAPPEAARPVEPLQQLADLMRRSGLLTR